MISGWVWRLALVFVVAMPRAAGAAPSDLGTFGYSAPAECPTRVDFSTQVAARTTGWLLPSSPFAVVVSIERDAGGVLGRLTFARGQQNTVRELQAAGCNELVQALAFIVALLIDPQSSSKPLLATGEVRPPAVFPLPGAAPTQQLPARLWFIAGPELALETTMTGDAAFGERVFFGVGRGDRSLAMSSARLILGRVVSHAESPSGERAEFELVAARLEGCLLRWANGGLGVELCPFAELGRLRAIGIHRAGNVTRDEPWGSLGLLLRPTWTFSRRLVLGTGLGVQLPLRHYHFAFTGSPELTRTPEVAIEASLCLGVRFP